jgi:peroxiredoxin
MPFLFNPPMLSDNLRRLLALIVALACFSTAGVILVRAGIPGMTFSALTIAPRPGATAPPLQLPTLDGERFILGDLRGDVVVINFWATWCEPCRLEMPELQRLYESKRDSGLHVVGVNLGESTATARQWVDAFGLTFNIVLDQDGFAATRYQLRGQPSTYVIDPDGVITHVFYGAVDMAALEAAVQQAATQTR